MPFDTMAVVGGIALLVVVLRITESEDKAVKVVEDLAKRCWSYVVNSLSNRVEQLGLALIEIGCNLVVLGLKAGGNLIIMAITGGWNRGKRFVIEYSPVVFAFFLGLGKSGISYLQSLIDGSSAFVVEYGPVAKQVVWRTVKKAGKHSKQILRRAVASA